jgi:hypothetical protein
MEEFKPSTEVSLGDWMLTLFLLAIPLVGLIMLFVWAFGGGAPASKANFAKAALLWAAIVIVLSIIGMILGIGLLSSIF